jgi:hypothetical protein
MKKYFVECIARCMEFQRVKVEYRHPVGFLQCLPIPEKKRKVVTIEFITKFPRKTRHSNLIMVVVDKLAKVAHFSHEKMTHTTTSIVKIYMRVISRLPGIPKAIVSDKDTNFTSNLWRGLFKVFGTNINFSKTYHPWSDRKTERVNQVIEDMLRIYVMNKPSKWEITYIWLSFPIIMGINIH